MKRYLSFFLSLIILMATLPIATLHAEDEMPLQAMEQPSSFSVLSNTSITFSFRVALGVEPYNYQWQMSTVGESGPYTDIAGATNSEYALIATTAMNGYYFRCRVIDSRVTPGSETMYSDIAILQVYSGTGTTATPTASPANNSTIGINSIVRLSSTVSVANNLKIFYEAGPGPAANVPNPTVNSKLYNTGITAPATSGTWVVKAIATSTAAQPSAVATFTYTVDNSVARLTDVKSLPEFIAWKERNFLDAVPPTVMTAIKAVVARMTTTERATYLGGGGTSPVAGSAGSLRAYDNYGIPAVALTDGPAGLRITVSGTSTAPFERNVTYWPNASARAAMWSPQSSLAMGDAWGQEAYFVSNDILLAPGSNLHRSVLGGRNFEYYSEDPYLSGMTGTYEIQGYQSNNVGVCIKHYALNEQETSRTNLPTVATTRALRELYLRNFQYQVELAHPWTAMGAYNQINGVSAMQSYGLFTQILRNEWGFNGFGMTDWAQKGNAADTYNWPGATANDSGLILAGCEVGAPSGTASNITNAVTSSTNPLTQAMVDEAVARVLGVIVRSPAFNKGSGSYGATPQSLKNNSRSVAAQVGAESMTLTKNANLANGKAALPLDPNAPGQVLSLGMAASQLVNGGGGSGAVNMSTADSAAITQLNNAITNIIGTSKLINTSSGMGFSTTASILATGGMSGLGARSELVIPASQWATWSNQDISAIIYCVQRSSAESADIANSRGAYQFSNAELNIINPASEMARAKGIPFILVLNNASWMKVSEVESKFDAVLQSYMQGMSGGTPAARVLFGLDNPSGKTVVSVPIDVTGNAPNGQKYNVSEGQFGTSGQKIYTEGIFMGYRYYDMYNVPVVYPFGHGLSYTTFRYSDASLDKAAFASKEDKLTASITITNTGDMAGKEAAQFYIGAPGLSMKKPIKELKGYDKTNELAPGESQTLSVEFNAMSLASYDPSGKWVIEPGHYVVYFAASSQDIRQVRSFTVPNEIIVTEVTADALRQTTAFTEMDPIRITVTFNPGNGEATFQKSYASAYGGAYNYLPVPTDPGYIYEWYSDSGLSTRVYNNTLVPTSDTTLYAKLVKVPIEISVVHNVATASVTYDNDSETATKVMLLLALYGSDDKLLAINNNSPTLAANEQSKFVVSLPVVDGAVTAKAFLWDGNSYKPLLENASILIN